MGCEHRGAFTPKYSFDHVFPAEATNEEIYRLMVQPRVAPALSGINGTVFAYGVTSGGKTHTMSGVKGQPGMIPLMLQASG